MLELVKKSWKDLDKKLFVPLVLQYLIVIFLFSAFLYANGLFESFFSGTLMVNQVLEMISMINAKFIVIAAIFAVLAFAANCYFIAVRLSLTRAIIQRRSVSLGMAFSDGMAWLFNVALLKIWYLLIMISFIIIVVLLSLIVSLLNGIAGMVLMAALAVISLIFVVLGLLFSKAIMFIMDMTPWNAVKRSFKYFFANKKFAVITGLVIVLMALPLMILDVVKTFAGYFYMDFLVSIFLILGMAYSFALSAWNDVFVFNAYNSNKNFK